MAFGFRILIGSLIVGGLATVGAAGYYGYSSSLPPQTEAIVAPPTIPAERTNVDLTVTAPGSLVPSGKQTIRSKIAGQLLSLNVQSGDTVRAGDVLAEFDKASLQDALARAQKAVADAEKAITEGIYSAENAVASAQDQLARLQLEYPTPDRAQLALDQANSVLTDAQNTLVKATTDASTAQAERDVAKPELDTANSELAAAKTKRDSTKQAFSDAKTKHTSAQTTYESKLTSQGQKQKAYDDAFASNADQAVINQAKTELENAIIEVASAKTALDSATNDLNKAQTAYEEAEAAYQTEVGEQAKAESKYGQAQAAYEQSSSQIEQARVSLRNAEFAVRQAKLDLQDVATRQKLADQAIADAQTALATAQANLETARANTVDADLLAAIEQAQADLDAAVIRAPIDGQVQEVKHAAGDIVQPGEPLLTLINPKLLEVYTTVVEEDLPLVGVGQRVNLFFDAAPDADVKGHIDRIVPERIAGSDRPLYAVYIALDGALPEGLLPGMSVEGSIVIDHREAVLALPRAVVRARSDGTAVVEIWNGTSVETRTILVGLRGDVYVEILDGLREGDQVVAE